MHNKEIPRFPNKLKVIFTSGLRRFISSKEIFPCSRFYFSSAICIYKRKNIWVMVTYCLWRHVISISEDVNNVENARLDFEATLNYRSQGHNNLMRSPCAHCTCAFFVVYHGKYFISSIIFHFWKKCFQDGPPTSFAPISICVTTLTDR